MGLMYVFPVSEDETDFYVKENQKIILKTYGLPYVFWFYAFCCISVVFFMYLAIEAPVLKLIKLGDDTDATLGYSLLSFIGLSPVVILAFFFYEKRLTKEKNILGIEHRVYGIKVFSETFEIENTDSLTVEPFLSSPNMARMKNEPESAGFQNKGYYILWLKSKEGKRIQLDRHSRKADLEKLKTLLS
jgi:hypothetical protein